MRLLMGGSFSLSPQTLISLDLERASLNITSRSKVSTSPASIGRWPVASAALAIAWICLLPVPVLGQDSGDDGDGKAASAVNAELEAIRLEFEAGLGADYPEEYALFKKLDASKQAEVLAEFKRYEDKPDSFRFLKAINKLGLVSGSGEWDY